MTSNTLWRLGATFVFMIGAIVPAGCSISRAPAGETVAPAVFLADVDTEAARGDRVEGRYVQVAMADLLAKLPPPPSMDSFYQYGDVELIRAVQEDASAEAKVRASSVSEKDTVWDFSPVMGAGFSEASCPAIAALFKNADADSRAVVKALKNHWKRARPPTTKPDPEDYAYPSGHSSRAGVRAALLAAIAPERAEQILAKGRQAALNRVIVGKHYTSDAAAGLGLGNYLGQQMLAGSAIEADLKAAKAEWAKAAASAR